MTLVQALAALHAAGRIRSPWLPGMLAVRRRHDPVEMARVVQTHAGRVTVWANRDVEGIDWVISTEREDGWPDDVEVAHDPASDGCLLALLREASCDPLRRTSPRLIGGWGMVSRRFDVAEGLGDTEGEAIAAAIIALAVTP